MNKKVQKSGGCNVVMLLLIWRLCEFLIGGNYLIARAEDIGTNIDGKVYEFGEKNHYEFSSADSYISTEVDGAAYGELSIFGELGNASDKEGVPSFGVEGGDASFVYTYGDSLLTTSEDQWHLIDDESRMVDDIKLEENIMKGVLIVQTSKDGKKWTNDVVITNIFADLQIQTEGFYTPTDIQLINGCYYRIIVAYETRRKTESSKVLFMTKNNWEYRKYAEVYKFYLYDNTVCEAEVEYEQKYSLGSKVNTGRNNGYSGTYKVDDKDPHYGWELGEFYVSGYTGETKDDNGNPVFLKNVDDKITLWFNLKQDIDCLNGNDNLSISNDEDGYDQYFETKKTDFRRGALITRYTDYENVKHEPNIYTNYLEANASPEADTMVQLFEEGDYEIALDYEIKNDKRLIFGKSVLPEYTQYRIFFKFSVRNGNCMVYSFDAETGAELFNGASTVNGFKLDLAKSRYLDINIKKEVLDEGSGGLTEDVRFNRPAKDGEIYKDEGIYTFTVSNYYTDQQTTKKIYVGEDKLLKACVATGLTIKEIEEKTAHGALIEEDGTISEMINEETARSRLDEATVSSSTEADFEANGSFDTSTP